MLILTLFSCLQSDPIDPHLDSDNDGLTDIYELEIGTNPYSSDSDNDGFSDQQELLQGFDPLNVTEHPYNGGYGGVDWWCRDQLAQEGNLIGQVTDNFSLLDQHGDQVKLWDFCGRAVLLVAGAFWCGSCQAEVLHMQYLYDKYNQNGLIVMGLYSETEEQEIPTQKDLQRWVDTYKITFPVLSDDQNIWTRYERDYGIPSITLLAPNAIVISADGGSVDDILEDYLPY